MPINQPTLMVTGPTATGKTKLAVAMARTFDGEIVSADSRQVYRRMDLGTGKDMDEYGLPPNQIKTYLIDVAEPDEDFHLQKFITLAHDALDNIRQHGKLPIVAGGTPLYLDALLKGYDMPGGPPDPRRRKRLEQLTDQQLLQLLQRHATPQLLQRADTTQRKRLIRAVEIALDPAPLIPPKPPLENCLIIAPYYHREQVRERILQRLDARFEQGMADEIQTLHNRGISWERLEWFGLEYRHIARFLQGKVTFQEMHDQLLQQIRHFAKAQDIWFRKLERENHPIYWIPEGDVKQAQELIRNWLEGRKLPPPTLVLNQIHYGKIPKN